jgi:glycosyltransferase involved in cell wall biosynthesis
VPDASETKRRLRVLTLVDRLGTSGGGERLAAQITMRLDPGRFERTLCVTRWPQTDVRREAIEAAVAELETAGVRFLPLERRGSADPRAWARLVRWLRRERIDVLHSHKFGSNAWGTVLGTIARVPVIVAHEHTWSFEGQPLRRFVDREVIARFSDAFVAVSQLDHRRMIEIERIDPEDVLFVPNGIDALPPGDGERVRTELGIPADDPVVGTIAVMRPQKAVDVLVRAVGVLVREFPGLRTLVVGGGFEQPKIEALIAELGLGENVRLLGFRTDVADVLAAVDVAVTSSRFEGSPLSVMEYMDAGKPVVGTRVGGVPDLIEHGEHGLIVEPDDPEGLAGAVAELLREPERARRMGERGRERRRAEFDIALTAHRFEELYAQLHHEGR